MGAMLRGPQLGPEGPSPGRKLQVLGVSQGSLQLGWAAGAVQRGKAAPGVLAKEGNTGGSGVPTQTLDSGTQGASHLFLLPQASS